MTAGPFTPTIRGYSEATSLGDTDAFVIDRIGVGTMFIEGINLVPGTGGVMIYDTLASGTTDTWTPTDYTANTDAVVITTNVAGSTLAGFVAGAADRRMALFNAGPGLLTLSYNASGTAADGFYLPNSADLKIPVRGAVALAYDATNSRWRAESTATDPAALTPGTFGDDTHTAVVTVDASGQISDVTETAITFPSQLARSITYVIDGGGAEITTGVKGDLEIPFACTITKATLLADQSGSIVVNIWKDTYANYPPTVADKITASAPPTITTAEKSQDSTLTGWTTSITAGDTLRFNVDSVTTITRVTLSLTVTV